MSKRATIDELGGQRVEETGRHQERRRALLGGRGPGWLGGLGFLVVGAVVAGAVLWVLQRPGVAPAALEELAAAQSATEAQLTAFVEQWTAARDELDAMQEERKALATALESRDGDVATLRAQVEALEARIESQLSQMKRLRASAKATVAKAPPEASADAERAAALLALGLDDTEESTPADAEAAARPSRKAPPAMTIRKRSSAP